MATEIRGLDEQANYKVSQSVSKSLTTKAYMQCKKSLFIEKWKESLAIQNISPGNATPLLGYLANLVPVHGHHLQDSKQWFNWQKVDHLSKNSKKYPSELLDTNEMILERRICKTKLFYIYDDIWVDHAAIDSHIEVNVPTTAARAKGTLDLQNLGACLVLDHESGGRWRWWRQWWWRWWRSWHEIAQIATITEHNLKTFRFWAVRPCLHSLSPHFSSDSHLALLPPIAKKSWFSEGLQ